MEAFFIAQISMFAGNFAPFGWAYCHGQLMPIDQYTALFSLIGTTYGGDGSSNFALPDFRGRVPIGAGQGPGLPNHVLGESAGTESVTLLSTHMPIHNHTVTPVVKVTTSNATTNNPVGGILAATSNVFYSTLGVGSASMAANNATTGNSGGNSPFDIRMPSLGVNFVICLEGIYPSRN